MTIDCPWCDQPLQVGTDEDGVRCQACSVSFELAPEPEYEIGAALAA